jgi:hypothetical protein
MEDQNREKTNSSFSYSVANVCVDSVTENLTLLLMCVLIPLQKASAQINLDPVTLTVDGDSEKTTTTTDTDDITFTVNVLYLKDLFGFIDLSTTTTVPEGATLTPTLNPTLLYLTQGSDQDVTITAPRTALTVAGTYTIVFTANHDFTFPQRPISTTLTITVERSGALPSTLRQR